jgi:glucose-1-phosphatase
MSRGKAAALHGGRDFRNTSLAMTQPSLSPGSADVLLFDLGRVVLDFSFDRAMTVWAGHAG